MIYFGFFLFLLLAFNFFFRAINFFIKINKIAYSENTTHSFKCTNCSQSYKLTGPEAKKLAKGSIKTSKSSPKSRSVFYSFTCPKCGAYSKQEKLFDVNRSKFLGNLRVQADYNQVPLIVDFLLKGVLPIIIIFPFLSLFTR
ncbi:MULTISPECIES: hypothetical protein [Enterococcus]|uniref:hypothetical protein n=1 Tax=Enterococcus sp. AZ103 TaxID=2774628 RepID=UPI003F25C3FF